MLPQADSGGGTQQSSGRRSGNQSGMVYLSNKDLSTTPKAAKILGCKLDEENKFGSRVILKLALDGNTRFWGVTIKRNPNYRLLIDKFGPEENDWVGQGILLHLEKDEFSEKFFPRVGFPAAGRSGR